MTFQNGNSRENLGGLSSSRSIPQGQQQYSQRGDSGRSSPYADRNYARGTNLTQSRNENSYEMSGRTNPPRSAPRNGGGDFYSEVIAKSFIADRESVGMQSINV